MPCRVVTGIVLSVLIVWRRNTSVDGGLLNVL
jgi:hypothetical protein